MIKRNVALVAPTERVDYPIWKLGIRNSGGYETVHIENYETTKKTTVFLDICDECVVTREEAVNAAWKNDETVEKVRKLPTDALVYRYVLIDGQVIIYVQVANHPELSLVTQAAHITWKFKDWHTHEVFKDFWDEENEKYEEQKRETEKQRQARKSKNG